MAGILTSFFYLSAVCWVRTAAQAANECSLYTGWKDYNASWYTRYASISNRMYPFGTDYCDSNATVNQKSSGFNAQISFTIPFYGSQYNTALISSHGYVTFNESSATSQTAPFTYIDVMWPNPAYVPHSSAVDPPFVAPFYAELDYRIGYQSEPSQLSWRTLDPGSNPSSASDQIAQGMLGEISQDVREAVIGAEWFVARWGLIVTWYNVTYSGAINCSSQSPAYTCPRNTFQMALVTDGVSTYTVFNYLSITWIGGAYQQKCDPATGTNSASYPSCSPAQVGFNAGFGRGFTALPMSGLSTVDLLDTVSGTPTPGRWIYSVAGNVLRHGGCLNYYPPFPTVPPSEIPSWSTVLPISNPVTRNQTSAKLNGTTIKPTQLVTPSTSYSTSKASSSSNNSTYTVSPTVNNTTPIMVEGIWAPRNWSTLTNDSMPYPFDLINVSSRWPLVAWPNFGPMLGGQLILVSGPCFYPDQLIVCRFEGLPTRGYYVGIEMKAVCIQPTLSVVGLVQLSVSLDGGLTYMHHTTYTSLAQDRVPELSVTVDNPSEDWLNPAQINLHWFPSSLNQSTTDLVTVAILAYHDHDWIELYRFTSGRINSGTYSVIPSAEMCTSKNDPITCAKYSVGAFRVSLDSDLWETSNPRALYSPLLPIAWFTTPAVIKQEGSDWAHRRCKAWYDRDGRATDWINTLPSCPCTAGQAFVDFGSFQQALDCNSINTKCPGNQGASACFQSTVLTRTGSSSRCCYGPDGSLMYSGDGANGSKAERNSPWGDRPFNIPTASYMKSDVIPYLECCVWQVNNVYDCYNQYLKLRATPDCKYYNISGSAFVYGDPHIITFDGTRYTFGGWGEFWLLRSNQSDAQNTSNRNSIPSFSLMGRFEQPSNQSGNQTKSTILTAVAMKLGSGMVISVTSNTYSNTEKLLVYYGDKLVNFSNPNLHWQQYKEMLLIDNDPVSPYRNLTIILQRVGIGINVAWIDGLMNMRISLPGPYRNSTEGLMGTWNGNPNDDLIPRNSTNGISVDPSQFQEVFHMFGNSWFVQVEESIFTHLYRGGMNHGYYQNQWFVPQLGTQIPPNSTLTPQRISDVCGSDNFCSYDLIVTGNETLALATMAAGEWEDQRRVMGVPVQTCGWLSIPYSTRQYPVRYTVGSEVVITGCMPGYMQSGDMGVIYVCQSVGPQTVQWTPPVSFSCTYLNGKLPPAAQAAIAVPVVVICSMIIAALLAVFLVCQHKRKAKKQQKEQQQQQQPLIPISATSAPAPRQMTQGKPFQPVVVGTVPVQREDTAVPLMENRPLSTGYVDPGSPPMRYSQVVAGNAPDYFLNTSIQSGVSVQSIETAENAQHMGIPRPNSRQVSDVQRLEYVPEVDGLMGNGAMGNGLLGNGLLGNGSIGNGSIRASPAPPSYNEAPTAPTLPRTGASGATASLTSGAGLLGGPSGAYQTSIRLPYADSVPYSGNTSGTMVHDARDSTV